VKSSGNLNCVMELSLYRIKWYQWRRKGYGVRTTSDDKTRTKW